MLTLKYSTIGYKNICMKGIMLIFTSWQGWSIQFTFTTVLFAMANIVSIKYFCYSTVQGKNAMGMKWNEGIRYTGH